MVRRQRLVRLLVAACTSAILVTPFAVQTAAGQDDPVSPSELSWSTDEGPVPQAGAELDLTGIAVLPSGESSIVGNESGFNADPPFVVRPAAWWSPDGVEWETVTLPAPEEATVKGVVATPSGFVAAGNEFINGLVWTSGDGREWSRPTKLKGGAVEGVASTSIGPVLTGAVRTGKVGKQKLIPTLWRLDEGGHWKPTRVAKKGDAHQAVVSHEGIWLVRGSETVGKGASATSEDRVWRSVDGKKWRQVDVRRAASQDGSPFRIGSLVAAPRGFLATANYNQADGSYLTTVMASPDGLEWTEAIRVERLISTLVSGPLGIIALGPGSGPGTGAVLRSVDGGLTWEEASEATFDGETHPVLATGDAEGFLALDRPFGSDVVRPSMVWRAHAVPPGEGSARSLTALGSPTESGPVDVSAGAASCEREGTIRSLRADVMSEVVIENRGQDPVALHWLDYDGKRVLYAEVQPGETLAQPAYETHPWVVTGSDGRCLTLLVPPARFVVEPD